MSGWTEADIPGLSGRVAVVTGANTGLGKATAAVLARHGAHVILACRDEGKGEAARAGIVRAGVPADRVEVRSLDLASQSRVLAFADSFRAAYDRLDLLINNAGRAAGGGPRSCTADGFEAHFGVNHLGHMALTLHLLPALTATRGARVVTLTSGVRRAGRIRLDDPSYTTGGYRPNMAYAQSKLANILFSAELASRLAAAGHDTMSLAADPGYARTELVSRGETSPGARILAGLLIPISQSAAGGAGSAIRAATDPRAAGGQLYAPRWGTRGAPVTAKPGRRATDQALAAQLWDLSLRLLSLDNPATLATRSEQIP
jgi:NAD(P)-dependent dehydrogenase (short-subunit alcohol dehydrogenase family)